MNCVSCAAWVKRGAAKKVPDKVKLSQAELASLVDTMQAAALGGDEDDEGWEDDEGDTEDTAIAKDAPRKRKMQQSSDEEENGADSDIDKKYDMSDYDEENDDPDEGKMKISAISTFTQDQADPFLEKDDIDSDDEDMQILPVDNLLAIGKVKKDYCGLEVFVFNESEDNCWCHHDIIIPTFPLAMEWMDFDPGEENSGNFVAMGTMAPDIEIWDLDVVDSLEPAFVLAGAEKKKKKKKKLKAANGHTDAVLDLSWNKLQKNVLASASADYTIGLWDLSKGTMVSSIQHHKEKVQTLQWHPIEPQSLVSGSFDKTALLYDCRSPQDTLKKWKLPGEVERVTWNQFDPYYFLASSDTGHVYYLDTRTEKPVFTLTAHEEAVTGLVLSSSVANCLVTASADHDMKVWDIKHGKPVQVFSKDMKLGQLQCAVACPDSGMVFAFGGENDFRVVNLSKNSSVVKHFNLGDDIDEEENDEVPIIGGADEDEPEEEEKAAIREKAAHEDLKKKKKKKKKAPKQES